MTSFLNGPLLNTSIPLRSPDTIYLDHCNLREGYAYDLKIADGAIGCREDLPLHFQALYGIGPTKWSLSVVRGGLSSLVQDVDAGCGWFRRDGQSYHATYPTVVALDSVLLFCSRNDIRHLHQLASQKRPACSGMHIKSIGCKGKSTDVFDPRRGSRRASDASKDHSRQSES